MRNGHCVKWEEYGIKEKIRTVRWTLHKMNRMPQGKGKGSRVKMVLKENERKTAKKKKIKNNGGVKQWQRKGKKRECIKTNFLPTTTFPSQPQSNTLKGLLSHPVQSCTKVKMLSCIWTCLFNRCHA